MSLFSKISILLGILLLLFGTYLVFERYNPKRLGFDKIDQTSISSIKAYPKKITIPVLSIELEIYPAKIKNNNWDATTKGVSYLSSSPVPGEAGNSILYGHNFPNLLGNLPKIKPGDEIKVTLSDGQKRTFVVEYTSVVTPGQTEILKSSNDIRITLYTCTGFLDSKRFVAVALLKEDLTGFYDASQ